jgi:hypothetical protein
MKLIRVWAMATTVLAIFMLAFALFQPLRAVPGEKRLYAVLSDVDSGGLDLCALVRDFADSYKKPWTVVVLVSALILALNVMMEWLIRQDLVNLRQPGANRDSGTAAEPPFKLFSKPPAVDPASPPPGPAAKKAASTPPET